MNKREMLDRLSRCEEDRLLLGRVWDRYDQCRLKNLPSHTAFLTPQEQSLCRQLLQAMDVTEGYVFFGGYDGAERQQLHFLPDWLDEPEETVCALRCHWYQSEGVSHRDLLGSLMGLGITRESVGDILVAKEECSADVLTMDATAAFLLREWTQAGRTAIKTEQISLHDLHLPQASFREIRDTVASLRLDSVVSSAFSVSRGRAAEFIQSGKVQINWQDTTKSDRSVSNGDVITVRGLGKCELSDIGGPTRKGRWSVTIKRYT